MRVAFPPSRRLRRAVPVVLTAVMAGSFMADATLAQSPSPSSSPSRQPDTVDVVDGFDTVDTVQPDIIVIMVDDLADIPTDRILERLPNIRRLFLREGKRFTEAFNEVPLCCPARANFHSGQHALRNGIVFNNPRGFDHTQTLAMALDEAGYETMLLGKYLNHYNGRKVPPGWDRVSIVKTNSRTRPQHWQEGKVETYPGRFFDDVIRTRAAKWMTDASLSVPVFEFISPFAPHRHPFKCGRDSSTECQLTPAVMPRDQGAAECRGIGRFKPPSYTVSTRRRPYPVAMPSAWRSGWPLVRFCESLLVVDRMVGQLEAAQKKRDRPAVWVFMSDNGMAWGQHGFPQKHVPWATPLPFYMAGPDISSDDADARVSIIDIPVTIAEIGGASMPWADGISLMPLLSGATDEHRTEILELMPAPPANSDWEYRGWEGIRSGPWRYVRWDSGLRELYDLSTDPGEIDNVQREQPEVVAQLDARLDILLEASRG